MPSIIQPSFATGELSPKLYARVDLAKYHTAAALLRNMIVDYRGGVTNRPGTKWIGMSMTPPGGSPVRLIPFIFSSTQAYILEFGEHYMRVIRVSDSSYILSPIFNIIAISKSNPCTIDFLQPQFLSGLIPIFVSGIGGMVELNNRFFFPTSVGVNSISISKIVPGGPAGIDSTGFSTYTGGGIAGATLVLTTQFTTTAINEANFVQSADVMTITHPNLPVQEVRRLAENNWTITDVNFGATLGPPPLITLNQQPAVGGPSLRYYVATAVDANGVESTQSAAAGLAVNFNGSYMVVSIASVVGAVSYNVYAADVATAIVAGTIPRFGFIGSTDTAIFNDIGYIPDFSQTPPLHRNPLNGNNPRAVAYFQQRQIFGGSNLNPATLYGSRTGQFTNMDMSDPIVDDDAIEATLVSQQVNPIQSMIAMPSGLVVFTSFGAWLVSGAGQNQALTPSNISVTPQAYVGSSGLAPLVVNYEILYVSFRGNAIRDITYDFWNNIFKGTDISVLSSHLFQGFTTVAWAYAESPYKTVWAVRNDGKMLSLAFLKEQEVQGWAQHTTQGVFSQVCSVPGPTLDDIYVVTARTIGSAQVQYIERMMTENKITDNDIASGWYLDCALQYSGAATNVIGGLDQFENAFVNVLTGTTLYQNLGPVIQGRLTLPVGVTVTQALIGFSFTSELQTLRIDMGEPTQQGKRKLITSLTVRIDRSYGFSVGPDSAHLTAWNANALNFDGDIANGLYSGDYYINIGGGWDTKGQVYLAQTGPFPFTVLGVIPEAIKGDTQK